MRYALVIYSPVKTETTYLVNHKKYVQSNEKCLKSQEAGILRKPRQTFIRNCSVGLNIMRL